MAGTEYTYTIRFSGDQALADATSFKQQLEQRLGTLSFKTRLDLGSLETTLRNASERAARASGTVTKRAMQQTIDSFSRYAERTGAKNFAKEMEGSLAQALAAPSKQGVTAINALEESMRVAQRSTQKLGFTLDEYLGASSWEKRFAAIQAAQRRLWGVRGLGYQIAGMGRSMMAGGGLAVGAGVATMKQYVDLAGPLNRAARNLDLNVQLTEQLDSRLRQLSGTLSYLTPKLQAESLYLWAAATGEVIDSTAELDQVLERNLAIQKLMILGAVDQETAVEAVTDVISQYGMNVSETERIVDTFITVAANSKAEVGDLGMAFSYAGTRAAAANTDFEETAAVMELLAAAGLRGSRAGRGVSRLIENLIAPSNVAKAAMEELFMDAFGEGTDILINAQGEFVGLANAISLTAEATENMTAAERANYVAVTTTENAARALTPLLEMEIEARSRGISILDEFIAKQKGVVSANRDAAIEMMEDIYGYTMNTRSATETAADYWNQYAMSVEGRTERMKASWSAALTTMGKAATESLLPQIEWILAKVREFTTVIEARPELMQSLITGGGIAVAVGALVTMLGKGLVLVADLKAIWMAREMKRAADENVAAAINQMNSARTQIEAAIMMQAAANTNLAAARTEAGAAATEAVAEAGGAVGGAAASAAGGAAGAGGGRAIFAGGGSLTTVALPIAAAAIATWIADQLAKLTTGMGLKEIFGTREEARAGREAAEAGLPTMSMAEAEDRAIQLREELMRLEGYLRQVTSGGFEGAEFRYQGIPGKYLPEEGAFAAVSPAKLIEKDIARATGELERYEQALGHVVSIESDWFQRHDYQSMVAGLGAMTDEQREAALAAQALAREVIIGKNALEELAVALGMSEEETKDWIDTFYDGTTNIGLGMDQIAMAMQMMSVMGSDLSQVDIAVAAGKEAQTSWSKLFAGTGDMQGFGSAQAMYQRYIDGLYDMLSKSQAATGAELQWEIDAYNQSWQDRISAAEDYHEAVSEMQTRAATESESWMMQFAGVMDYSAALDAARDFEREQAAIIRRYRQEAEEAGMPIDFTALEFALAANAEDWAQWADAATTAMTRVDSLKASALESGWSAWEGLAGIIGERGGPTEAQVLAGFGNFEQRLDKLFNDPQFLALDERTQSLRIAQFLEANKIETDAYSDAVSERQRLDKEWIDNRKDLMKQAEQGFRNLVSQGFQPTDVTQEDVMATKAGNYKDKWDEYARQVRAAMAGSQEWDWMIPDPVKQGGAQAINEWGQNILDQFYAGMMPDQVNWDAFVAQFQKNLSMAAGKERLVDRAIEELAQRGITATSEDVLSALGLQSPFQQYFFGGLSTEEAAESLKTQTTGILSGLSFTADDVETPASSWAGSMVTAMDAQLSSADLLTPISNAWRTQISERGAALTTVGEALGAKLWQGVKDYMSQASFVDEIVRVVLDMLGAEMRDK